MSLGDFESELKIEVAVKTKEVVFLRDIIISKNSCYPLVMRSEPLFYTPSRPLAFSNHRSFLDSW